eukprot:3411564-Prymnesium_polylepis.1
MAMPKMRRRVNLPKVVRAHAEVQQQHQQDSAPPASPRRSWLPSPRRRSWPLAPAASTLESHPSDDADGRAFSFAALHMTRRQAHVHRPIDQQQAQSPRTPRSVRNLSVVSPDEPPKLTMTRQAPETEDYVSVPSSRTRAFSGQI